MSEQSFAAKVWEKLSEIDLTQLTQDRNKFTYLPWAAGWSVLMECFPESNYRLLENEYFHDGTVSVAVEVTIIEGEKSLSRSMYLQVLNHKMQAIEHPNAHEINNARMRCLVKCLGLFGLGCYLYQGQDLPNATDIEVVAKQPRIPHEQHFENTKEAMDKAPNIEMLRIQCKGGVDYFKKWGEQAYCDALTEHGKKLAKTFEQGEKFDQAKGGV